MDEQTEHRFMGETGPSNPASFINNLNLIAQKSSETSQQSKNQYKTEEYKEIHVTYIDPNENAYQSNQMRRDSFDNMDDEDEENVHDQNTTEDEREIELKTTQRNPLLFSDNSNTRESPSETKN